MTAVERWQRSVRSVPRGGAVPAVILGASYNTFSVARSLGARGVEVHVLGDAVGGSLVRHSRYVTSFAAPATPGEAWSLWCRWLDSKRCSAVVLACSDSAMEFISKHRSTLTGWGYRPGEADDAVTTAMLDKATTYELARRVGVETPRTATVVTADQLREVADEFSYPCALKPRDSYRFARRFGTKGVVAGSRAELEEAFAEILPTKLEMLVTEIVPGVDDAYCSYYSYLDEHGEPLFHFTKRKLRQYPPGFGFGTYHVSDREPEAVEIGLRFFQGVGLRGIGNVEFKRDRRDGRLKLIECNARFTAADGLVRRAGIDIAWIAYQRALGRPVPPVDGFRSGVRQWHPYEDFNAFLAYRRAGRLTTGSWLASLAHPQHLPVFAWRDPLPSLAHDCLAIGRAAKAIMRRGRGGAAS